MTIFVNGEPREVMAESSVQSLLIELAVPADGVAVALNGQVLPRAERGRALHAGDRVELIRAVGGG